MELPFLNHASLHEEARNSWDYFVSDELIYIVEMQFSDSKWNGINLETYLDFQYYLVMTFKGLGNHYCCSIVEFSFATQPHLAPALDHRLVKMWNNMPVFIDPVKLLGRHPFP